MAIRSISIDGENDRIASGPGLLTKRFLIDKRFNGIFSYDNKYLKICERNQNISINDLVQTTRIGITKAKDLKWRWYLKNSRSISKRIKGDNQTASYKKYQQKYNY